MKILALDISTKSTGWFVNKRSCGIITPSPELSFPEKLCFFRSEVSKLVNKHKPNVVVIEDTYSRFGNIHTLKQLCKFAGVAMEACASIGVQVETITATQARKYCCGKHKGEFKKPEVFDFFVEKYALEGWTFEKYNDITDAMALWWGYRKKAEIEKKVQRRKTKNGD